MFRHGLGGEGLGLSRLSHFSCTHLASTGPSMERHHDTLALALNNVGHQTIAEDTRVHVDETLNH